MPDTSTGATLLLSGPEVARRLGIGISTLHALRRADRLPLATIRLGRAVRYRADELRDWTAAGCPARRAWEAMRAEKPRMRVAN